MAEEQQQRLQTKTEQVQQEDSQHTKKKTVKARS